MVNTRGSLRTIQKQPLCCPRRVTFHWTIASTFNESIRIAIHRMRALPRKLVIQRVPHLPPARACLLESDSRENARNNSAAGNRRPVAARIKSRAVLLSFFAGLLLPAISGWAGQAASSQPPLPDAPRPQLPAHPRPLSPGPCQASRSSSEAAQAAGVGTAAGAVNAAAGVAPQPGAQPAPCPPLTPPVNWYARFIDGPKVKPMTPAEKAWLAARNVVDPFNALTILASSAIAVGSDADSPYGPGMKGFGRYVGVSYTQDITAEFVGTFMIASLVRQDPHYHRMTQASIQRRIAHAIYQVAWTQGDNGKGMVNYADLAGGVFDDEIGNLYVPGQKTNLPASAERYGIGLATAPIDNFVTEFVPDVARRIHVRVVLIQRIINQVAKTEGSGQP